MKKLLLAATVMTWAFSGQPTAALAASSWIGPGSDFNTGSNWSAGVPTSDEAIFNSASPTQISLSGNVSLSTFTFNPGAAAYTITIPNALNLTFAGGSSIYGKGIVNNAATRPTVIVNNGGAMTFLGLTTAGNAVIQNSGTLDFDMSCPFGCAASTAANATITNAGLLMFSGFATAGNAMIVNVSTIQLSVNFAQTGTLGNATVLNNGLLDASAALNSWSVGSLEGSGDVRLGSQPVSIGGNDLSTTMTGAISGAGTLTKNGLGTLTLGGTNSYTGLTTIVAGELRVLGSLASDVQVSSGGTLSGNGHISKLTNAGIVAPGSNGIGQLTAETYTSTSSGTLRILINGSSVPSLQVVGAADISNGTLTIAGSQLAVGQYSVLESNALTGVFSTVNVPGSLFLIAPMYSAQDVLLRISFATPFSALAQTTNQRDLASNLEEFKPTTTSAYTQAITTLAQLPAAQIPNAFDQISGDSLASFQDINFQNATVFSKGMRQRVVNVSSGSYGLWAQGMGWSESIDGKSSLGSPAMQATTGGFQAGYDYAVTEGLVLGVSGGYGETSLDVTDRSSEGNTTSIQSGLYAAYAKERWMTSAGTALTSASNHMTRAIRYGALDEEAQARFASRILSTFVDTEYTFQPQKSLTVSPAMSLRYTHLAQEAFTESGGSGLDLAVDDRSFHSLMSSLGAGVKYSFGPGSSSRGFIALTTAWEHEYCENENALSMRFADTDGGGNYTVRATPRDRNAAAIGLQGEVPLKGNLAFVASYTATIASAQTAQSLFGGARLTW